MGILFILPGIPLALVIAFVVWTYRREYKRRAGLRALAEKYGLQMNPDAQMAPDPGLRGLLFPATYPRYMQGQIGGVPAVAFDFRIGIGRGSKLGSGAGVKRPGLTFLPPSFAPMLVHKDGWTFLHTEHTGILRGRQLTAEELEQLWGALLWVPEDSSSESAGTTHTGPSMR